MNLSDTMVNEIKKVIPREITIELQESKPASSACCNNDAQFIPLPINSFEGLSTKQREKLDLVLEIKAKALENVPIRQLAREYKLSRVTVKKYIEMNNPNIEVKYDNSTKRYCYLDPYRDEIRLLCNTFTVKEVKEKLEEKYHEKITYSNLTKYIRSHQMKSKELKTINPVSPPSPGIIKIFRSRLIKYIFGWKLRGSELEFIESNIEFIIKDYGIIHKFKEFYENFKRTLVTLNWEELAKIIDSKYECKVINRFIKGLSADYEAVMNAAKYSYSNGCVEGNVNKLKKIKRDMYGRAHINLLRNKVIYQSLYF